MARLPRLTVPGVVHHVIQRGNNRQAIFSTAGDYQLMLQLLEEHSRRLGVAIHAYVLMSNHFHVLATPETLDGIPQLMQSVGRRYVRLFNDREGRSGTLWEGRYRSTLVQSERYLLACMAYIDLNPVRAGMVATPADYPWSSHGHYIGRANDKLITPHDLYWQLGNTPFARELAYTELVNSGVASTLQQSITRSALQGWALAEADYIKDLQQRTERRMVPRGPGRPRKHPVPVPD